MQVSSILGVDGLACDDVKVGLGASSYKSQGEYPDRCDTVVTLAVLA